MHINNTITDINNDCVFYNLFIPLEADIFQTKIHLKFILGLKTSMIVNDALDYYRHTNNSFYFYKFCYNMIVEKKIAKF